MGKLENLTGVRFGRLVAIERAPSKQTPNKTVQTVWKCRCDCGKEIEVRATALKSGNTQSCGCRKMEMLLARNIKHGGATAENKERLYSIWKGMISRCRKDDRYAGRGVAVCDEWKEYSKFRDWAYSSGYDAAAPFGECTIDRINNDGDYEPNNCRWVSLEAQANNTRKNRHIVYNGETKTISEWARTIGISADALWYRLKNGWSIEDAITIPPLKSNKRYDRNSPYTKMVTIHKETKPLLEWCSAYGIDKDLVGKRLKYGWSIERAITTPKMK